MNHTPYFYIIKHKPSGKQYAGCKYAADANPENFMTQRGYKTSSAHIKKLIKEDGLDSFEIIKILTEVECGKNVFDYESDFLVENECAQSSDWLNRHNNNKGFKCAKKGHVSAVNLITGEQKRISKEEFDSSPDWVSPNLGLKRTEDTKIKLSESHIGYVPSYATREKLKLNTTGTVPAVNLITGEQKRISKEEFDSSPDWIGTSSGKEVTVKTREKLAQANSGKVTAKHVLTGVVCSISKEEFDSSPDWVSPNLGLKRTAESKQKMRESSRMKDLIFDAAALQKMSNASKGTVSAVNLITGEQKRISQAEFDSSEDWVGHGSKKIKRLVTEK